MHWDHQLFFHMLGGNALESGFSFIPILVDRFEFTTVHEERRPRIGNASGQIIQPQVNSQDTVWQGFHRFWVL